MRCRPVGLFAFLFLVFSLFPALSARAQPPQNPPLRGVVRDAQGRTAPGTVIYFRGWEGAWPDVKDYTVTADANGEFVWEKPDFPFRSDFAKPEAFALPNDGRAWRVSFVTVTADEPPAWMLRQTMDELLRQAKTLWGSVGGSDRLIVELPPTGLVEMTIRGPDGNPARNAPVQLWPPSRWPVSDNAKAARWDGKTDAEGKIRVRFFPGPRELLIVVPGVGFGVTGIVDVKAGATATPELPALAPFATIAGRVAPEIAKSGQVVRFARSHEGYPGVPLWANRQARTDAEGRFVLRDVTTGETTIYLFDSEKEASLRDASGKIRARRSVLVASGRGPEEVLLTPPPKNPLAPAQPPLWLQENNLKNNENGVLAGVVQDAAGKPVAGATVLAILDVSISRLTYLHRAATTGADGSYRITGLPRLSGPFAADAQPSVAALIAVRKGYAPTLGRGVVEDAANAGKSASPLVFPAHSASLTVVLTSAEGLAAAGVPVQIEGNSLRSILFRTFAHTRFVEANTPLWDSLSTVAMTDGRGVARFENLLPDRYTVTAARLDPKTNAARSDYNGRPLDAYRLMGGGNGVSEIAVAWNVPVAPVAANRTALRLQKIVGKLSVRAILPDGSPLRTKEFSLRYGRAAGDTLNTGLGRGVAEPTDVLELAEPSAFEPGLSRLEWSLSDAPPYNGVEREPRLTGATVIAYSPFRARRDVVEVALRRAGTGRVAVAVRDENDKPVRAAIYQDEFLPFPEGYGPNGGATTDAAGTLTLSGLPSGEIKLRAEALGDAPFPALNSNGSRGVSFPTDAALRNRRRWRVSSVRIAADKTRNVVLRAERVGWVRGVVHKIQGAGPGWIYFDPMAERDFGTGWGYDQTTGEYLIGPLPPGRFAFSVSGEKGGAHLAVAVAPGEVTQQDITLDSRLGDASSSWQKEDERRKNFKGTVFLPDGITPAAGALALIFDPARPGQLYPAYQTDGIGRLSARVFFGEYPFSLYQATEGETPKGGPKKPVIVAFLPGSHGAALIPLPDVGDSRPLRIVLPPALTVSGVVAVGSRRFGPQTPGMVRIRAACLGQGNLNATLSVETTAESDGAFRLAGLTRGKYIVQAALDDIYLSPPTEIAVTAAAPTPALTLTIPEPGGPLVLSLGAAYAGTKVRLADSPVGPLVKEYAARYYSADGAGRLRLEGLPAGKQRLRLEDGRIVTADIPPL